MTCTLGQSRGQLKTVDVNYMLRGYFYAASEGPESLNGPGGWGGASNGSIRSISTSGRTGIEIFVDTSRTVPMDSVYKGTLVRVRNHGPDTVFFPAQDSRLYMWTQALRSKEYADIEYLPSSWCGNSYHTLFLAPGEHWEFVMPKYEGRINTRLRLALKTGHAFDLEGSTLYSHSFPGAVNKGQFKHKQGHAPQGLMDPYLD
ncbi:MAG: hypothetical protein M3R08_05150 [Bacteroidota bacterium]|nr:hypothetical protein [Bacteroidota bacterium]